MKVVVAIDSLKGSLSSMEAGQAIADGIRRVEPAQVVVRPLADGGEGTVEALVEGMNGRMERVRVTGPLGEPVECAYGILEKGRTAIIEMSGAAGLPMVPPSRRNPMDTTTYGVGEVIRDAVTKGCRHFIVGIGGSATNDGGIGMLQALGFDFLKADGTPVDRAGRGLGQLARISGERAMSELSECTFRIACDVNNPLCGENGCSAVYGPQKGADEKMVRVMDGWFRDYARLAKEAYPQADASFPGTGAAGGLGFAFLTFTNAALQPGIDIVLEELGIEADIRDADFVVTGEGRLDFQTAMGKAPVGVARLAKKHGKPVLAFAGAVTKGAAECNKNGIDAFFPILREVVTLEEAMDPQAAAANMTDTAEQAFRLIRAVRQSVK